MKILLWSLRGRTRGVDVKVRLKDGEPNLNNDISRSPLPSPSVAALIAYELAMTVKEPGLAMDDVEVKRAIEHSDAGVWLVHLGLYPGPSMMHGKPPLLHAN